MNISLLDPPVPPDFMQEGMQFLSTSTPGVMFPAVMGGYLMGGGFSLFGSMLASDHATQCLGARDFFKVIFKNAHRMGYNFALFGALFTGIDVALEKRRGRKDIWNPTITGALLGGYYGRQMYRRPGLIGGTAAGAVFSVVIEHLMRATGMAQA